MTVDTPPLSTSTHTIIIEAPLVPGPKVRQQGLPVLRLPDPTGPLGFRPAREWFRPSAFGGVKGRALVAGHHPGRRAGTLLGLEERADDGWLWITATLAPGADRLLHEIEGGRLSVSLEARDVLTRSHGETSGCEYLERRLATLTHVSLLESPAAHYGAFTRVRISSAERLLSAPELVEFARAARRDAGLPAVPAPSVKHRHGDGLMHRTSVIDGAIAVV